MNDLLNIIGASASQIESAAQKPCFFYESM